MANKADAVSSQAGGEGEGAAEDEWVRMASRASKNPHGLITSACVGGLMKLQMAPKMHHDLYKKTYNTKYSMTVCT